MTTQQKEKPALSLKNGDYRIEIEEEVSEEGDRCYFATIEFKNSPVFYGKKEATLEAAQHQAIVEYYNYSQALFGVESAKVPIDWVVPHSENSAIYGDLKASDLAEDIYRTYQDGTLRIPAISISPSGVILSGHRRQAALSLLAEQYPEVEEFRKVDANIVRFDNEQQELEFLLRENNFREKSPLTIAREMSIKLRLIREGRLAKDGERATEAVGSEYGVSHVTVSRRVEEANAIDEMRSEDGELKGAIDDLDAKGVKTAEIAKLQSLPKEERAEVAKEMATGKTFKSASAEAAKRVKKIVAAEKEIAKIVEEQDGEIEQPEQSAEAAIAAGAIATDDRLTPSVVVDIAIAVMGEIDLDPFSDLDRSIPAKKHYTFFDNGLQQPWEGKVFSNPPYSDTRSFAKKLGEELASGRVSEFFGIVDLNAIATRSLAAVIAKYDLKILVWTGRLDFAPGRIARSTEATTGNNRGNNAIIYYGKSFSAFCQYENKGLVLQQYAPSAKEGLSLLSSNWTTGVDYQFHNEILQVTPEGELFIAYVSGYEVGRAPSEKAAKAMAIAFVLMAD